MKTWAKIGVIVAFLFAAFITIGIYSNREVVNAFDKINKRLEEVNVNSYIDNDSLVDLIQNNKLKTRALFLRDFAQVFQEDIEKLKKEILEGVNEDKEVNFFIKDGVLTDKGISLATSMQNIHKDLINNALKGDTLILKKINRFYSKELSPNNKETKSWLSYHFEGYPTISVVTKLTNFQSDVQTIEKQILTSFVNQKLQITQ